MRAPTMLPIIPTPHLDAAKANGVGGIYWPDITDIWNGRLHVQFTDAYGVTLKVLVARRWGRWLQPLRLVLQFKKLTGCMATQKFHLRRTKSTTTEASLQAPGTISENMLANVCNTCLELPEIKSWEPENRKTYQKNLSQKMAEPCQTPGQWTWHTCTHQLITLRSDFCHCNFKLQRPKRSG